jgi:hypothetical protein
MRFAAPAPQPAVPGELWRVRFADGWLNGWIHPSIHGGRLYPAGVGARHRPAGVWVFTPPRSEGLAPPGETVRFE